ncbi:Ion channel regulatory protein UNC-93 [Geosmithia morbida]|uniref:Ion channel regulatory protein UNC-93 n=1 Tax=Geosmithia morbida TaxID=1094350 RepID=A0A9P4YNF1_9HYPO|nr:Ion channel regulatory protein UNC-93 [Geosmithia morbida]KAF4119667.1 Ion channel regulatory protein UNC-93 [Geosmithia morbida]
MTKVDGKEVAVDASQPDTAVLPSGTTNLDMDEYQATVPLWRRVWQHSLTQMMLLSVQAFCGPAMADAIAGLGGGGLATPRVNNITNALTYATLAITCFLGGPIVNKLTVKWALVIGSMSFPIQGSAYYCNSKFGNQWYLILSGAISGVGTGCWYVAEAGSIMTLAPSRARGKYLALWIVSRNLGQLVGGAINLSKNYKKGLSGGVSTDTYLAFLVIECLALPFAFLILPFENVVRSDGTKIVTEAEKSSTKSEFRRITKTITSRLIVLSSLWALWSFFYGGSWSTYLGIYFSRRRAQVGLWVVVVLNVGVYIWSIIMQVRFNNHNPGTIDWDDSRYARSFLPYFFIQTTGPLSQSYMYWLLSSFAANAQENVRNGAAFRCVEAVGQAIAYAMNTQTSSDPLTGFCVTFGLLGAALIPMHVLVNSTPDQIPADEIAQQQNALGAKTADVEEQTAANDVKN